MARSPPGQTLVCPAKETIEKFWCNKIVTAPPNVAPAADSDDPDDNSDDDGAAADDDDSKSNITSKRWLPEKKRKGRGRWLKG